MVSVLTTPAKGQCGCQSRWLRRLLWPAIWSTARLLPRNQLVVLAYHQIAPEFEPGQHFPSAWTSCSLFYNEIRALGRSFPFMRLSDALRGLREQTLRGTVVALTFDDGHASVQQHVVPFLAAHGIPASFFINSKYIGNCECAPELACVYWRRAADGDSGARTRAQQISLAELRNTNSPAIYWKLVRQIEALGPPRQHSTLNMEFLNSLDPSLFEIGLHGHQHHRFSMMSETQRRKDLEENICAMSSLPGYRPIFAMPYGKPHDWDREAIAMCLGMGLDVCLANGGVNRYGDLLVQRMGANSLGNLKRWIVKESLMI